MIEKLLQENVQEFIRQHANDDEQALLLKHKTIYDVPASIVAWQIAGRRKAQAKIPVYYNTSQILYPPGVNLEQSSSAQTAAFKASVLAQKLPAATRVVDLSGGFGVDTFFLSQKFKQVVSVEPNADLLSYARHNHVTLNANNVQHVNSTAEDYLESLKDEVDCFYIDPSRRSATNNRVVRLADCEPDVVSLLPQMFRHAHYVLIKAAPLLDIQLGMQELSCVDFVWVVSVKNEVKELLFLCSKHPAAKPALTAVNLETDHQELTFEFSEEQNASVRFSDPLTYLYEPNASILKAGAFKLVAERFSLAKLHPNTHLYTSNNRVDNFPGRIFEVTALLKADLREIALHFPGGRANVISRNHPLPADALKKKLKLQDGGEKYLIGCAGQKQKFLIAATRLK